MKYMIKWLALVGMLVALFCCSAAIAAEVASGTCGAQGDNLTWTLDDSGTLTISGTGDMADYDEATDVPWYWYGISDNLPIRIANISNSMTSKGKGFKPV